MDFIADDVMQYLFQLYARASPAQFSDGERTLEMQENEVVLGPLTSEMKKLLMVARAISDEQRLREDYWKHHFNYELSAIPAHIKETMAREDELFTDLSTVLRDMLTIAIRRTYNVRVGKTVQLRKGGIIAYDKNGPTPFFDPPPLH
ncbi:MAG: hypothetical protein AAB343_03730 [Patescibacteria group bacterium]